MELYHVLNRGVDKRSIVKDDVDRMRFIHDLFAFNDADIVTHAHQPARRNEMKNIGRKQLVDIHAFCLMENHYHLILSALKEDGIARFMQKLNMGYTKYFNERHERLGTLWQGKYKSILIERDAHMLYIPLYVHLNPLDYSHPEWRSGSLRNAEEALGRLREYRWSSHLDYLGARNFPSLLRQDFLASQLGSPARYMRELKDMISRAAGTQFEYLEN